MKEMKNKIKILTECKNRLDMRAGISSIFGSSKMLIDGVGVR